MKRHHDSHSHLPDADGYICNREYVSTNNELSVMYMTLPDMTVNSVDIAKPDLTDAHVDSAICPRCHLRPAQYADAYCSPCRGATWAWLDAISIWLAAKLVQQNAQRSGR